MTLDRENARDARFKGIVRPKIDYLTHREHLPCVDPSILDKYSQPEWNELVEFLASAADQQPFCDPTFWQSHEKASFVRWLRSWKV